MSKSTGSLSLWARPFKVIYPAPDRIQGAGAVIPGGVARIPQGRIPERYWNISADVQVRVTVPRALRGS